MHYRDLFSPEAITFSYGTESVQYNSLLNEWVVQATIKIAEDLTDVLSVAGISETQVKMISLLEKRLLKIKI